MAFCQRGPKVLHANLHRARCRMFQGSRTLQNGALHNILRHVTFVCRAALCVLAALRQLQQSDDKLSGTRLAPSCGGECLVSRPPDLPHWKGGWVYPRARTDTVEKTLTSSGMEARFSDCWACNRVSILTDCPVHSYTVYEQIISRSHFLKRKKITEFGSGYFIFHKYVGCVFCPEINV
jgi:hypothetical protein